MNVFLGSIFALLISTFLINRNVYAAPDRIGNGGGAWSCEGANGEIFDLMFMDIFEARREYQLNVPEIKTDFMTAVREKKDWIVRNLPSGSKIQDHIEYVEKNITWIDDIIVSIPDAANKISPHPSLCKQGKWAPIQMVNFTDDFRILVRKEIFTSALLTEMERAAVYLHEGIYSYLRTEFEDNTSVRTRAIVGIIFSDLSDSEKIARIDKIIKKQVNPPDPDPKPTGYYCGLKPDYHSPLYTAEAPDESTARANVVKTCKDGEDPFKHFPFPFGATLSKFPDDLIPGPGMECKEVKVSCEKITTSKKIRTCQFSDFFGEKKYEGYGRTRLEAQKEAIEACMVAESRESLCYQGGQMSCQ